jgi:hypothetical protein
MRIDARVSVPLFASAVLLLATSAAAQQSASFRMSEHTFNAGGHPSGGQVMASASFRLTYDAVGAPVVGWEMSAPSFRMDASFGSSYRPPGEVAGLRFDDDVTLAWNPERSTGTYGLYRDLMSGLPGLGYGACLRGDLGSAGFRDTETPPHGSGFFYLVTASNRLREEGTKGQDSTGNERANAAPCP